MSTMLGRKAAWGERTCGCCEVGPDKRGWKRAEEREWRADVSAECSGALPAEGDDVDENDSTVQSDYFDDLTKRAEGAPRSNANAVALLRAMRGPAVATKRPTTAQDGFDE